MNETSFNDEPKPETATVDDEPQFGLLDIVEAFTAMRHQWRTQSKENRDLAQSLLTATDVVMRIESTLDQKLTATTGNDDLNKFISLVIDLDISLTRAVEATSDSKSDNGSDNGSDGASNTEQTALLDRVRRSYEQSGFFSRMFSRKVYLRIIDSIQNEPSSEPNPTVEGVRLVLNRLRRMMAEQNLTRVETVGKAFDGETMQAISAIESNQFESGVVVQEITPAYFYNGQLVRVAEVRVAK